MNPTPFSVESVDAELFDGLRKGQVAGHSNHAIGISQAKPGVFNGSQDVKHVLQICPDACAVTLTGSFAAPTSSRLGIPLYIPNSESLAIAPPLSCSIDSPRVLAGTATPHLNQPLTGQGLPTAGKHSFRLFCPRSRPPPRPCQPYCLNCQIFDHRDNASAHILTKPTSMATTRFTVRLRVIYYTAPNDTSAKGDDNESKNDCSQHSRKGSRDKRT